MPKPSRDPGAVTDIQYLANRLDVKAARLASSRRAIGEVVRHTKKSVYAGIDPGASGGFATIGTSGNYTPMNGFMIEPLGNKTDKQVWELFQFLPENSVAVIEANTGYVGGGGNPGSAMFKFGVSYGKLLMALTAAGIPFETAVASAWQKALGISPRRKGKKQKVVVTKGRHKGEMRVKEVGGESKTEFKKRLLQFAQRLFPSLKITLATADALLIAEFCRRKREGLS